MVACGQRPNLSVSSIAFNRAQMVPDVEAPSNVPTVEFWKQFFPLFSDTNVIFSFMVKEKSRRLY
jgi:hypothetical protein